MAQAHDGADADEVRPRPAVSAIIVVKNGEAHLQGQLDALQSQVGAPPFEVIVVDNGSTDGTAKLVRRWIEGPLLGPAMARLVDASSTPGIPYARNQGALASRAHIIAYCDADDVVAPTWIAGIAAALKVEGAVAGPLEAVNADGSPRPDASIHALGRTAYLPYAPAGNLAVTRDCFFSVGGFDESLPRYGYEDIDFSWRLQKKGFPLTYAPGVAVRITVSSSVGSVRKEFSIAKARMAIVRRHPEFDAKPYSLRHCSRELATTAVMLPLRLLRPRGKRTQEVRWLVDAAGRLAGQWHYGTRRLDGSPILVHSDPVAAP